MFVNNYFWLVESIHPGFVSAGVIGMKRKMPRQGHSKSDFLKNGQES
jgi:hypothetical protein